ncbi:MAG: hypothetical protein ACRDKE_07160 [Solirubrobacterales bacterium]
MKTIILGLAAALFLLALSSTSAMASRSQQSVVDDPARILSPDPALQTVALDEAKELGFDILKIPVTWRSFAPDGTSSVKPAVDLTNSENYPAGVWTTVDAAVAGAEARGMKVWLMITAPAPRWAVTKETSPGAGAYEPNPADYAEFVTAVGKRYANARYFSFWNEVNLKRFMQPQSKGGLAQSAIHYRDMYRAAQKALASSGHASSTTLFGEILSRYPSDNATLATRPMIWLRAFFCLDTKGLALKGNAAKKYKCGSFPKIKTSGLAYHPYNLSFPPTALEKNKENAPIGYLPRVEKLLDQAYKAKHLATKKLKIYNSEYGIQSNPPDRSTGQPLSKVPFYLNASEYLTWIDARVATYSQYLLIDDPEIENVVSFQTGLRFADGTKKPGVYEAFQTPFMVFKTANANTVTVWGCLRAKTPGTATAKLEVKTNGKWTSVKSIPVSASTGYFMQKINLTGAKSKTYRINWSGGISRWSKPGTQLKNQTN